MNSPASRARDALRSAWAWLRWPAALALLVWLFHHNRADFADLDRRTLQWPWLGLAFALCFGSIVSTYLRWWLLVWSQGFPFRVRDALRIGFLGYLFNYVAPGAVGGDFAKAMLLAREQTSRRWIAGATVAVDRIVGLIALLLTGAFTILLPTSLSQVPEMRAILHSYLWLGLAGLAGLVLLMSPFVTRIPGLERLTQLPFAGRAVAGAIQAISLYQSRPRVMAAVLVVSVAGHVAMLSSFYCCARGVHGTGQMPGFAEHLQFLPAAELAGVLVPVPAGMGALEGAIAHFYQLGGASAGDGTLTGVTYRAISLLIAAVGAICYATIRRDVSAALRESEAEEPTADSRGDTHVAEIQTAGFSPCTSAGAASPIAQHEP